MSVRRCSRFRVVRPLVVVLAMTALAAIPFVADAKRNGSFSGTANLGKEGVLRIQNRRGDILIRRGADSVIQVHAQIMDSSSHGDTPGRYTAAEIILYLERRPPIQQKDDDVLIGSMVDEDFHLGVEINYDIVVPAWASLDIETAHGKLEIQEVGQRIEVQKESGPVLVWEPEGLLKVKSQQSQVQVVGTPRADWSVESKLGAVKVFVPQELGFELDAESKAGQLESIFPLGEHKPGRFEGVINGGGPRLHLRSEGGAIGVHQR